MYNILSVTSYSGVGKTTLIENIVKLLTSRGYKVGTIKHTCHDFDVDCEGKDSYKPVSYTHLDVYKRQIWL